jgi:hypothetical protein
MHFFQLEESPYNFLQKNGVFYMCAKTKKDVPNSKLG